MKRMLCALLALLVCGLCPARAENGAFADVAGNYDFSSGAGAWCTELTLNSDGSFTGNFHDTDFEIGEYGGAHYEAVTNTVSFTGRISPPEHSSAQELETRVLELKCDGFDPYVEDGVLYRPTEPYGIAQSDTLRFFMAGAYIDAIPEDLVDWLRMKLAVTDQQTLPFTAIYDGASESGFSGEAPVEPTEGGLTWEFIDSPGQPQATEAPLPALALEPEEDAEDAADAGVARAGITYPVQAEVVNCKTGVSLRSQPSTRASLLCEVPLGALVQVYGNAAWSGNDRWFVEASYNGQRGYICVEYLDILLPESLSYNLDYLHGLDGTVSAVNRGTDLILRDGPGTNYDSLGLLFGGEVLGYLGEAKRDSSGTCWYHCSHYGEPCWISAKYTALTLNDGTTYTGSRGIF